MPGKIFITGGSGFVGLAVIAELLARNYSIHALTNHRPINPPVTNFKGSLFDDAVLDDALCGCDAAIHLVGIIMEKPSAGVTFERIHNQGTRRAIDAAKRAGVRRYLQMSALGTRPDAVADYHRTKYLAEQYVRGSGLDWTIFRPALIHGPGGEFIQMEAKWARKMAMPFLFMPYFGVGLFGLGRKRLVQPVFVGDVARAFVDALEEPNTIGEVYPLGGAQQMTWPAMHEVVAKTVVGHKRWTLPIPTWYATLLTKVVPAGLLPFNRSQIQMAGEDNACDNGKVIADFGWTPAGFETSLKAYADQL
jgi:NADH dehydrogenase